MLFLQLKLRARVFPLRDPLLFRILRLLHTDLILLNLTVDTWYKRVYLGIIVLIRAQVDAIKLLLKLSHVSVPPQLLLILHLRVEQIPVQLLLGFPVTLKRLFHDLVLSDRPPKGISLHKHQLFLHLPDLVLVLDLFLDLVHRVSHHVFTLQVCLHVSLMLQLILLLDC